jgi:hypothetical protein
MDILSQVIEKVKILFDEQHLDKLAREVGFMKRKRKIVPKRFLETLLVQHMESLESSLEELSEALVTEGETLSKQAVHQKLTPSASEFVGKILNESMKEAFAGNSYLNGIPFVKEVKVIDSSEISLTQLYKERYPNTSGKGAAVKIQAYISLLRSQVLGLEVRPAREPDQGYAGVIDPIEAGDLWIGDLGYYCVETFCEIKERGAFFLSRYFKKTNLYTLLGEWIDIRKKLKESQQESVELQIKLGKEDQLPSRLVAIRLSQKAYEKRMKGLKKKCRRNPRLKRENLSDSLNEWSLWVTNLPESVTANEVYKLYYLRWQIELFFKAMKSQCNLRSLKQTNEKRCALSLQLGLLSIVLLNLLVMTIVDKEVSLYKAGKVWKKNIREFFTYLSDKRKCAIAWFRAKLYRLALKETRLNRPSSRSALLRTASHAS